MTNEAGVRIVSVRGNPTPQELAALTVAVTTLAEQQLASRAVAPEAAPDWLNVWVEASRRSAQRAGLQRGPWRISGRIARRSRL